MTTVRAPDEPPRNHVTARKYGFRFDRIEPLSPTVRVFHVTPCGEGPFRHEAGQWVSLEFPAPEAAQPHCRAYSIASAPREDGSFEICASRVPGGRATEILFGLSGGEMIPGTGPHGNFRLAPSGGPLVFIANGTGIAPLRAMIQELDRRGATVPIRLLFGARTEEDVLWRRELEERLGRKGDRLFAPTLTRPSAGWKGRTGRVQDHIADVAAGLPGAAAHVCGTRAMVQEVKMALLALGYPAERILYEKYD